MRLYFDSSLTMSSDLEGESSVTAATGCSLLLALHVSPLSSFFACVSSSTVCSFWDVARIRPRVYVSDGVEYFNSTGCTANWLAG